MFAERLAIAGFGHRVSAEQARERLLDRRALHLCHEAGKVEAGFMLGQIPLELDHRLVEHDRKAGGGVERGDIGDIALDQHDTGLAQSGQRCFENRGELGVEIFPEIVARQPEAQPFERSGRDFGGTAGNDAVEEHAVGNMTRHRSGGVTGM